MGPSLGRNLVLLRRENIQHEDSIAPLIPKTKRKIYFLLVLLDKFKTLHHVQALLHNNSKDH
jgi:hypothetical protein